MAAVCNAAIFSATWLLAGLALDAATSSDGCDATRALTAMLVASEPVKYVLIPSEASTPDVSPLSSVLNLICKSGDAVESVSFPLTIDVLTFGIDPKSAARELSVVGDPLASTPSFTDTRP